MSNVFIVDNEEMNFVLIQVTTPPELSVYLLTEELLTVEDLNGKAIIFDLSRFPAGSPLLNISQ